MRELYYGRHGQSVDLTTGHRSRPETVLTDQGWREARQGGALLVAQGIEPNLIVCSTLPRAIQSAQAVADIVGYQRQRVIQSDLLNERDWGQATGVRNSEIKTR